MGKWSGKLFEPDWWVNVKPYRPNPSLDEQRQTLAEYEAALTIIASLEVYPDIVASARKNADLARRMKEIARNALETRCDE